MGPTSDANGRSKERQQKIPNSTTCPETFDYF